MVVVAYERTTKTTWKHKFLFTLFLVVFALFFCSFVDAGIRFYEYYRSPDIHLEQANNTIETCFCAV